MCFRRGGPERKSSQDLIVEALHIKHHSHRVSGAHAIAKHVDLTELSAHPGTLSCALRVHCIALPVIEG
jgi:hypothetical protein